MSRCPGAYRDLVDGVNMRNLEGYNGYHTLREGRRSGGVSVFCLRGSVSQKFEALCESNDKIELCAVDVKCASMTTAILAIYRPHSSSIADFTERLMVLLQLQMLQNQHIGLLGDFNINLLATNCPHMDIFMNNLQTLHYLPLITRPTRFPCPTQLRPSPPSILDHIWTDLAMPVRSRILCADLTDHCPTFLLVHNLSYASDSSKLSFRSQKV